MGSQTIAVAVVTAAFFLVKYFNKTDIPKIKNLPEIPGVPIFGNLIQLGQDHALKAGEWVKKYGDVFQVRLGNKVGVSQYHVSRTPLTKSSASSSPTRSTR